MPKCVCDLSYCPACEPQRQAHKSPPGVPASGPAPAPESDSRLTASQAGVTFRGSLRGRPGWDVMDDIEKDECV